MADISKIEIQSGTYNIKDTQARNSINTLTNSFTNSIYFYLVDDYGAIGDGVTDDTTAIQNCINDAKLTNGVVLFNSKKQYLLNGILIIDKQITLDFNNAKTTHTNVKHLLPAAVFSLRYVSALS